MRVGYIPITHCLPLYVAMDRGAFTRRGLEPELVPLQGGPKVLEALAAGDLFVGFSNVASIVIGRSKGVPFVPISGGSLETPEHADHAILVAPQSPIRAAGDLRGHRIAINSRRNIDHLMVLLYLRQAGLAESDVTLIEVPFPRMEAALVAGAVDAIASVEPYVTGPTSRKVARIVDWNYVAVRPRTFVATFNVMERTLNEDPEGVAAFREALAEATAIIRADPDGMRPLLAEYTSIPPDVAKIVGMPEFLPQLDVPNIEQTEALLLEVGLLDRPVGIGKLLGPPHH